VAKALNDVGRLGKEARGALEAALEPGEIVRVIIDGTFGTAMVGTDRRVLVWKKKTLHSFPYGWIGELGANYGLLSAWAQLRGPSLGNVPASLSTIAELPDAIQLANGQKDAGQALATLIAGHQAPGGPQPAEPSALSSSTSRSSHMPGTEDGVVMEAEGNGGHLWLYEDRVLIKHFGFRGLMTKGFLKGDKEIPLEQITAVQWREPGALWLGHIQFTIVGGTSDTKNASQDENAVMFEKAREPEFRMIKGEIDQRRTALRRGTAPAPAAVVDVPAQIRELAKLRDDGLLTSEEFAAKKADLLARM
jgi:hypothetical protein